MITVAGIDVVVEPEGTLSISERALLRRLGAMARPGCLPGNGARSSVKLRVADDRQPMGGLADPVAVGQPAQVGCHRGMVTINHACFEAILDPKTGDAVLQRRTGDAYPLEITLRTAVCCVLPRAGGLPLHAAAVIIEGWAVVFFGCSGAGKSTLAATSPYPVLSDELVAVRGRPWRAEATGFWGELAFQGPVVGEGGAPLKAVIELGKGSSFRLDRISENDALRRLLHVAKVPVIPTLWSDVLSQTGRLVKEISVYRMAWRADSPPWGDLRTQLGIAAVAPGRGVGDPWTCTTKSEASNVSSP